MTNEANEMMARLSRELNLSPEETKASCARGDTERLLQNVDSERAKQVKEILSDPERAREMLNSPQAQALMKLLGQQ